MIKLFRALFFLCLSVPMVAWACGDDGQRACGGGCTWYIKGTCPFCIPWCHSEPLFCHKGNLLETEYQYLWTGEVVEVHVCRKYQTPPPPPPPPPPTPAIEVNPLPSRLNMGSQTLTGMEGYYAVVQMDKVDFVTPDSDTVSPNGQYIVESDGSSRPKNCADINQKGHDGGVWRDALLNLTDWHVLYPAELLVNANWFDVLDPFKSPHVNLCSNIHGLSVSRGRTITAADKADRGNLLDALLLITTKKSDTNFIKSVIVKNAEINLYNMPQFAVSGFIILKNGVLQDSPDSNNPATTFSRTAVGLSADRKQMILIVEQRGRFLDLKSGLTAAQMAGLMKHYGAADVLNLDNSGSSQLVYYTKATDTTPRYISKKGDLIDCEDPLRIPCNAEEHHAEEEGDFVHRYRPVPNFLGIKVKH